MVFHYTSRFRRSFKKRPVQVQARIEERIRRFMADPKDQLLRDHALSGSLDGLRSFSVTGDIRVLYEMVGKDLYLLDVGTHSELYG